MGLDIVELIMEIEDEFDHPIDEETVVKIQTVGDLHAVVIKNKSLHGEFLSDDIKKSGWLRIQKIVAETFGVKPEQITPDTRLIEDLGAG